MTITKQEIEEASISLVKELKKHFKMLREQAGLEDQWKAAERAYNNDLEDFYRGVAKVRIPALNQAVEIIVPRMDKTIFDPSGEFFGVEAKDKADDISQEDAVSVKTLIEQQFKDIGVRGKLISGYRDLCIYGTLFVTTYWDKRTKKRYKRVNGKREEMYDVVYDNPDFYFPSIWDIYIDPKDEKLEGFLIQRIVKNWHELWSQRIRINENNEEVGIYNEEAVLQLKDHKMIKEEDSDKEDSDHNKMLGNHRYSEFEHKIDVLKCYGPIPKWLVTGKEEDKDSGEVCENAVIELGVVGDFAVVLRSPQDNPFDHLEKPFLRGRYIKLEGQAYGHGVMTVNIPLQMELNTLRSQLMDLRSFILKKKWLINRDANIDSAQLEDINNLIIETDDVNGIRDVVPADFGMSALPQEQIIKQDIQDSTGATKLLGGTPSGSSLDRTATGISLVAQGGLERFELVVTQFEEDVLKPLVNHFWFLNQQFLPEGRDVALTGNSILRVIPSEIPLNGLDLNFTGIRELGERGFKIGAINNLIQNLIPYENRGIDTTPLILEQIRLLGFTNLLDKIDQREETDLEATPEGEVRLLQLGRNVRINFQDDHAAFLKAYESLLNRVVLSDPMNDPVQYSNEVLGAIQNSNLKENVRKNLVEAIGQRLAAIEIKKSGFKQSLK